MYSFFMLVLTGAVIGYSLYARRNALTAATQQYADYTAAKLAQKLGLRLVEGDPEFNLVVKHASQQVRQGPSDTKPLHISIRMEGESEGTPIELIYLNRVEQTTGFNSIERKVWFNCRMVAHTRNPFPPFEVVSRKTPIGTIALTTPVPPTNTGDMAIDSQYQVATAEPRMAQELAKLLPGFAMFSSSGVHLVGDGKTIAFIMNDQKAPLVPSAIYFAEAMQMQLTKMAKTLGG